MVHRPDPLAFVPVPTRPRRDGWSPRVQADFIAALVAGGSVTAACAAVGRSAASAYALRKRPDAIGFAAAWDFAAGEGAARVLGTAIERALHGSVVPIVYRGRIVGERIVHNDGLLLALLRRDHLPARQRPGYRIDSDRNDRDDWL